MKTIVTILTIVFFTVAGAQDVIITLTGVSIDTPVELDSILIDNLSNGTSLALYGFPVGVVDYDINLTKGDYNSIYDIGDQKENIVLSCNSFNKTQIIVSLLSRQSINVEVFDLSGRILSATNINGTYGQNLIEVKTNQMSLIKIRTDNMIVGFKSIGNSFNKHISIQNIQIQNKNRNVFSGEKSVSDDFVYSPGDSIKITVINNMFHSNFIVKTPENGDHFIIYLSRPCLEGETLTDYDGNIYNTVKIGNQCWMKENLNTTHYADGEPLVDGTGIPTWDITTKYWFIYGDEPANAEIYGRLYAWAAIMNGEESSNSVPSGVQGVCPNGWHIPSKAEWEILVNHLGGGDIAGGKLKESGYEHWEYPNTGANNESGFYALAGGHQYLGYYGTLNTHSFFWSSTVYEYDLTCSWSVIFFYNQNTVDIDGYDHLQQNGRSIRCLKD